MPLEPIEERDLDMKSKFIEKIPSIDKTQGDSQTENILITENKVERQEGAVEKDDVYVKILSKAHSTKASVNVDDVVKDADLAIQEQSVEAKVNNLVNIAMQKGVAHAVSVARHMNDNYMLDNFHDKMMMDDLHDALLKNGLIKNI